MIENKIITKKNIEKLKDYKSILIVGMTGCGKTELLKEIQKFDIHYLEINYVSLSNNIPKDVIDSFSIILSDALNKNENVYIDESHYIKEHLIQEYFLNESTSSKLVVALQGIEDIKNTNLLKKFDIVLSGRNIQNNLRDLGRGMFFLQENK